MEDFFHRYAAQFTKLSASGVGEFYRFPVTVYSEAGEAIVFDTNAFQENTKKLFELYQALGVTNIRFEMAGQQTLNESLALVSVQWFFLNEDGLEVYSATTRYTIALKTMRIVAVTVVDETSKVAELSLVIK